MLYSLKAFYCEHWMSCQITLISVLSLSLSLSHIIVQALPFEDLGLLSIFLSHKPHHLIDLKLIYTPLKESPPNSIAHLTINDNIFCQCLLALIMLSLTEFFRKKVSLSYSHHCHHPWTIVRGWIQLPLVIASCILASSHCFSIDVPYTTGASILDHQ